MYPPSWDPAEEARAVAYRLQARARVAATTIRERGLHGNAGRRLALNTNWLAYIWRTRDERDPDPPDGGSSVNG